jgi:hypothetical protein
MNPPKRLSSKINYRYYWLKSLTQREFESKNKWKLRIWVQIFFVGKINCWNFTKSLWFFFFRWILNDHYNSSGMKKEMSTSFFLYRTKIFLDSLSIQYYFKLAKYLYVNSLFFSLFSIGFIDLSCFCFCFWYNSFSSIWASIFFSFLISLWSTPRRISVGQFDQSWNIILQKSSKFPQHSKSKQFWIQF